MSLDVCVLSVQICLRVVCSTSLKSECKLLAAWSAPGHGEVKNEVEAPIKIDFHDLNERPSVGTPTDFNKIFWEREVKKKKKGMPKKLGGGRTHLAHLFCEGHAA